MQFIIEDLTTFSELHVLVDDSLADQFTDSQSLFDPSIVAFISGKTNRWPTLGVATHGWDFCSCAIPGDRISAVELAIDSGRVELLSPIINAIGLRTSNGIIRAEAVKLSKKLLSQISTLGHREKNQIQGLVLLLAHGAIEEDDFFLYEDKAVWFSPVRHSGYWVEKSFGVEEGAVGLSIEKDSKASFLTALLLSDSKDFPFRDQALMSILATNPVRAIQYRDKARDNSTLAHLCVVSDRPEILQRLIELLGEHVLNEVDAKGRNPEVLAVELNRHACVHVARTSKARFESLSILNEITR